MRLTGTNNMQEYITGNCRIEFIKWLVETDHLGNYHDKNGVFLELPFSCQYGVYVDFFDSGGIHIEIHVYSWDDGDKCFESRTNNNNITHHKTRPEARISAIEKANELHNSK